MKIKITRGDNELGRRLAATPSLAGEAEFKKLMIVEELLKFMKKTGINRSQLAKRMGVQPSRVTSMLTGSNNFTIETLVRAGRAVGAELHQTYADSGLKVRWTAYDPVEVHEAFSEPIRTEQIEMPGTTFDLKTSADDDKSKAA